MGVRGARTFLSTFLLAAVVVLLSSSPAAGEAWQPGLVDPGEWRTGWVDEPGPAAELSRNRQCPQVNSGWAKRNSIAVSTEVYTCGSEVDAKELAGFYASRNDLQTWPPVFGKDIDFAVLDATDYPPVISRVWVQGPRVLAVDTSCRKIDIESCKVLTNRFTKSYATTFPGKPVAYQQIRSQFATKVLSGLTLTWLIFVGIPGLVRYRRRDRYPVGTNHRWTDVRRSARQLLWRSVLWGSLVLLRRICLVLAGLTIVAAWLTGDEPRWLPTLGLTSVAACCAVGAWYVWQPLFGGVRTWRGQRRTARSGWHFATGLALRLLVRATLFVVLLSVLFSLYVEGTGGFASEIAVRLEQSGAGAALASGEAGFGTYYVLVLIGIGAESAASMLVFLAIITTAALVLVDQLGARLLASKADLNRAPASKPEVLYLRNFGDDRLRLRAARISRRGLLERLSPQHTRPFEHVVIRRLSTAGYAYAVNPPNQWVFGSGVPKAQLENDQWKGAVNDMAHRSLFVAISATPAELRDGFLWEIEMLAQRLGHQRIMLVLGSWRAPALAANWRRFVDATAQYPLFADVARVCETPATHVMVHLPGIGWEAWGATTRSEWTYAAAIEQALRRATPYWRNDEQGAMNTQTVAV